MYAKLAWRNIRRSVQDYGLYFLTLVFAVAIFYVFNSLADQPSFVSLRESTRRMAAGAVEMLEWLTVIMTGVVALLVLYANRVIIKKRSRELGTYLLLGMEQGRLALLLMAEVTLIGMAALAVGLAAGIFLSQFFALVVARLFGASLTGHAFVFSGGAAMKTLLTYGLAFVAVGLWQAAAIYRQKLIDLITGAQKNEEMRLRRRPVSLALGVLSLLALGRAYWLADQVSRDAAVNPTDSRILTGVVLGVVGTYMLFLGASGLLAGLRRGRGEKGGWLSRGLNLFLYRQVSSKINTHAGMLATIALMLTFTICAMSFGLGLGRGVVAAADQSTPFDYLFFSADASEEFQEYLRLFDQYGVTKRQEVRFFSRKSELRGKDLMLPSDAKGFEGQGVAEYMAEVHAQVVPASAYNRLRELKDYGEMKLPETGFLLHFNGKQSVQAEQVRQAYERFLGDGSAVVDLAGQRLRPAATQVFTEPLGSQLTGHAVVLVVPDAVAAELYPFGSYLVLDVKGEAPAELDSALVRLYESRPAGVWMTSEIRAENMGRTFALESMLLFLVGYIGVMFTLISATLLALQQVTDAVEHRQRFEVLRKLGADDRMIDGTIARQVGLYFLTPVAVALLHSCVAMVALARLFRLGAGYTTVWSATLVTLGIFALIYGAYYLLSLQSCRTLFKEPRPQ
ncbi:MAG TPA: FtsX-like permease family protein [Symbiobacteriaceae bacterium]|nr:FtsX-like permease family protein [Symbiobacteriaceae bacterium]